MKEAVVGSCKKNFTSHIVVPKTVQCDFCKSQHYLNYCRKFIELPLSSSEGEVKRMKLSINYFQITHFANECRSIGCKNAETNTICYYTTKWHKMYP